MKFTKMHGCGNEYVYINDIEEKVKDPSALAIKVSNRHFGIGSDGLILIKSSKDCDFQMDMYNADGSQGKMCGNGIRCVAKYVYDNKMTDKKKIKIETLSGIKIIDVFTDEKDKVISAKVDMGAPIIKQDLVPVKLNDKEKVINEPIVIGDKEYNITCVSMGNPHCIVFVNDVDDINIEEIGPLFENNEIFPERINTEFVEIIDKNTIKMRVWERGSGETLACGTGACASVVASYLNGRSDNKVNVILKGGELNIVYDIENDTVFMTGPAEIICEGEMYI